MSRTVPRTPWPEGFPDVVVHGKLPARNNHPNYAAAKAGNAEAALGLVRDLLTDEGLHQLRAWLQGHQPLEPVYDLLRDK